MGLLIRASGATQGLQQCMRRSLVAASSTLITSPIHSSRPSPKRSSALFQRSEPLRHLRSGSIVSRRTMAAAASFDSTQARIPPAEPLAPPPPGMETYKVAVCQLSVVADKETNIAHAREVIEAAADNGAQLIVLPEMWNCPYSNDSFPTYAEETDGANSATPSSTMLADVAQKKGVTIIGGSIPERSNGQLYNTCYIFGKRGELKGKHRKVHLFDIDIPGQISFKESDTLTPGEGLTVVDTDVGRIGVGICYDIRFPEMAMLYAARGVHMIAYPGAFNMTTGPLHWELLQKARAVDNQLYVVTCSPARDNAAGYIAWGHSTIVGPFGEIVATTEEKEATVFGEIDYSQISTRRLNMPLDSQRRGDLYALLDKSRK
ncbi:unnamed protein product [Calypogeia fissa]